MAKKKRPLPPWLDKDKDGKVDKKSSAKKSSKKKSKSKGR